MKTILIVDDLQSQLDLMAKYLADAGYKIIAVNNGKEAIAQSIASKPDLIVTDWMMPEMGGLDVCRKLSKNPETEHIPVVACTAKDRDVDRMWAKKQGIKAYVTKPFTQDQLVNAVKEVIG
ncbi:MAG: response regulator [Pleurocapsa sp. SU_5_0]|nr:response regulator [Pleurocapsa sp. SU_5_0]NJO94853.1 response regulator [Pleurocapsa sp. CRU_1_2]NJR45869.1 response regulator [Hyellaceae cyanobacterium CSU_1_1]